MAAFFFIFTLRSNFGLQIAKSPCSFPKDRDQLIRPVKMRLFVKITFLAAMASSTIAGCASFTGRGDTVSSSGMERIWCEELSVAAQTRLSCSRDDLECHYLGNRVHLIEGCGRKVRYLIFERGGTWVKIESFHERASFELRCDEDALIVDQETPDIWRVSGCEKEKRYELRCSSDGLTCEWILDDGW